MTSSVFAVEWELGIFYKNKPSNVDWRIKIKAVDGEYLFDKYQFLIPIPNIAYDAITLSEIEYGAAYDTSNNNAVNGIVLYGKYKIEFVSSDGDPLFKCSWGKF